MVTCSYLYDEFVNKIDSMLIQTIVECGSRDCLDAISLYEKYQPKVVYAFECNPESIPLCKQNIQNFDHIKLIEKAICNKNGLVDFYPTDMERSKDKNIGASSLLIHKDNNVEYFQKHIKVRGIRLDTFMRKEKIKRIDLLCMDLQGAELLAIEGLRRRLKDVHYIISEISTVNYYHGDVRVRAFNRIMEIKGLKKVVRKGDNTLYINTRYND